MAKAELKIKEHPIIMQPESVRAILEGRKTMTRRTYGLEEINSEPDAWKYVSTNKGLYVFMHDDGTWVSIKCPYGQVGDRLWVKETWAIIKYNDNVSIYDMSQNSGLFYKADNPISTSIGKWRPSIFMPRWASRITLEITEIRVEQLMNIAGEDCVAEGVVLPYRVFGDGDSDYFEAIGKDYIHRFSELWDSINAKRGYPWNSNCWVWCLSLVKEQPLQTIIPCPRCINGQALAINGFVCFQCGYDLKKDIKEVPVSSKVVLPTTQKPEVKELSIEMKSVMSLGTETVIWNSLRRIGGIETVGDLLKKTRAELESIRMINQKRIKDIEVRLAEFGLSLKD